MPETFYAVTAGTQVGVFHDWDTCATYTQGVPKSKFKGFKTYYAAQAFFSRAQNNGHVRVIPANPPEDDEQPPPLPLAQLRFPSAQPGLSSICGCGTGSHSSSAYNQRFWPVPPSTDNQAMPGPTSALTLNSGVILHHGSQSAMSVQANSLTPPPSPPRVRTAPVSGTIANPKTSPHTPQSSQQSTPSSSPETAITQLNSPSGSPITTSRLNSSLSVSNQISHARQISVSNISPPLSRHSERHTTSEISTRVLGKADQSTALARYQDISSVRRTETDPLLMPAFVLRTKESAKSGSSGYPRGSRTGKSKASQSIRRAATEPVMSPTSSSPETTRQLEELQQYVLEATSALTPSKASKQPALIVPPNQTTFPSTGSSFSIASRESIREATTTPAVGELGDNCCRFTRSSVTTQLARPARSMPLDVCNTKSPSRRITCRRGLSPLRNPSATLMKEDYPLDFPVSLRSPTRSAVRSLTSEGSPSSEIINSVTSKHANRKSGRPTYPSSALDNNTESKDSHEQRSTVGDLLFADVEPVSPITSAAFKPRARVMASHASPEARMPLNRSMSSGSITSTTSADSFHTVCGTPPSTLGTVSDEEIIDISSEDEAPSRSAENSRLKHEGKLLADGERTARGWQLAQTRNTVSIDAKTILSSTNSVDKRMQHHLDRSASTTRVPCSQTSVILDSPRPLDSYVEPLPKSPQSCTKERSTLYECSMDFDPIYCHSRCSHPDVEFCRQCYRPLVSFHPTWRAENPVDVPSIMPAPLLEGRLLMSVQSTNATNATVGTYQSMHQGNAIQTTELDPRSPFSRTDTVPPLASILFHRPSPMTSPQLDSVLFRM